MRVLALSVGLPRDVVAGSETVRTSIFKTPVDGRRWVSATNIDGDRQADLTVHGGPDKAVYAYPSEHYAAWTRELGLRDLPWASFGENLTTSGLLETSVCIGDRFQIGTAEFRVTQPRVPCYKLAIRHDRADVIKRFAAVSRCGFYLAVEQEGQIGTGDEIRQISSDSRGLTVADVYRLKIDGGPLSAMQAAADHPALSEGWRESFRNRIF